MMIAACDFMTRNGRCVELQQLNAGEIGEVGRMGGIGRGRVKKFKQKFSNFLNQISAARNFDQIQSSFLLIVLHGKGKLQFRHSVKQIVSHLVIRGSNRKMKSSVSIRILQTQIVTISNEKLSQRVEWFGRQTMKKPSVFLFFCLEVYFEQWTEKTLKQMK